MVIWAGISYDHFCCPQELNVRKVTVSQDKEKYGVHLKADLEFKTLGARLKGALKAVKEAVESLSDAQLEAFQSSGMIEVCGHHLGAEDLKLRYQASGSQSNYEAHSDNDVSTKHSVRLDSLIYWSARKIS